MGRPCGPEAAGEKQPPKPIAALLKVAALHRQPRVGASRAVISRSCSLTYRNPRPWQRSSVPQPGGGPSRQCSTPCLPRYSCRQTAPGSSRGGFSPNGTQLLAFGPSKKVGHCRPFQQILAGVRPPLPDATCPPPAQEKEKKRFHPSKCSAATNLALADNRSQGRPTRASSLRH